MRLTLAAFALFLVGLSSSANAAPNSATQPVSIANFAFTPPTITINVGDSVKWTNLDAAVHSAVGQGGSFNTGNLTTNQSMTIAFNTAGTFAYICGIHGASMSGSVVVRAAATAPPTPPPTAPPTAAPTAPPTVAPTARPTLAPTAQPTVAPTAEPSVAPSPTITPTATATATPATTAPVAVASPSGVASDPPRATAAPADAGASVPLILAGAGAIVLGLGALAWVLLRR